VAEQSLHGWIYGYFGFVHIAVMDLMPELYKKSHAGESVVQLISILAGIRLKAYLAVSLGV